MKPAFTPGPWEIAPRPKCIVDSKKRLIGSSAGYPDSWAYPSEDEAQANAHLIAAAPDLYAALARCREQLINDPFAPFDLIDMINDALAKAGGQE